MNTQLILLGLLMTSICAQAAPQASPPESPKAKPDAPGATTYSTNSEANELFLKAREYARKSDPRLPGGALSNGREAIKLYEQAVAKDPQFALAYVEMARAWLGLGYSDPDGLKNEQIVPPAKAALAKALGLNDRLPEAHTALAALYFNLDYDWEKAENEYRRAVALSPNDAAAHTSFAGYLAAVGRFERAIAEGRKAEELAPSRTTDLVLARTYYDMRRYDDAAEYCRRSLKRGDNVLGHFFLGFINVARGKNDEAVAEFQKGTTFSKNGGALAGLAYGYAMAGRKDDARKIIDELKSSPNNGLIVPYRLAAVYLALGDKDSAIEWLKKEYADRGNWMTQLKVDPVMDPLRSDPRFQELMRQMRFPG